MIEISPSRPVPLIRSESCGKCKFATVVPGQPKLQCRRYPPSVSVFPLDRPGQFLPVPSFPPVGADEWCGEFALKLTGLDS